MKLILLKKKLNKVKIIKELKKEQLVMFQKKLLCEENFIQGYFPFIYINLDI